MNDSLMIPIFLAGTIMFVVIIFFMTVYLVLQNRRNTAVRIEAQTLAFDREREVINARLEEQENIMNQISKEIHDNIGQSLTILQMNMHMLAKQKCGHLYDTVMDNTNEVLSQVINTVQTLSHSLNGDFIVGHGLFGVLKKEMDYINTLGRMSCCIITNGNDPGLPRDKELVIHRIAQQAIHNTLRHAKADKLEITLTYDNEGMSLAVKDNGIGFAPDPLAEMKGIGLVNMRQRAKSLGGTLTITSAPGKGCIILFMLPYKAIGFRPDNVMDLADE